MLVPILIGAGLLGILFLSQRGGAASSPQNLPPGPTGLPPPPPGSVAPTASAPAIVPLSATLPSVAPAQVSPAASAASAGQKARVTTNDPPPDGDLIMRTQPSDAASQVPGGGAEKDGIVTVVDLNASSDGVWAAIDWPGGSRRPAAQGFCKKKFLTMLV